MTGFFSEKIAVTDQKTDRWIEGATIPRRVDAIGKSWEIWLLFDWRPSVSCDWDFTACLLSWPTRRIG